MGITVERVNPWEYADQIKGLYESVGRADFPEIFERMYTKASGVSSWVGLDEGGSLALHLACFPHRFSHRGKPVTGGLLVNWVAGEQHRTVFPALALVRRMRKDVEADGDVDFLYAVPNAPAAPVVKMAGFKEVAQLRRYAQPISRGQFAIDMALKARRSLTQLRVKKEPVDVDVRPAVAFDGAQFENPDSESGRLQPFRPVELIQRRLPGYPTESDRWIVMSSPGEPGSVRAAVLIRGPDDGGLANICSVWRQKEYGTDQILNNLPGAVAGIGARSISLQTLQNTNFSEEVRGAGFMERPETAPISALPLTDDGRDAVEGIDAWEVMAMDCNR